MNLWETLGVSPTQGLLAAALGLVAACVWAAVAYVRRSRAESRVGLGLEDR